jgi:hypothetical protein
MKTIVRNVLAAGLIVGSLGLGAGAVQAMPLGLDTTLATQGDAALKAENVRWVCGPYRCRWAPNHNYRPRAFYGPRRFYGGRGGWRGRRW